MIKSYLVILLTVGQGCATSPPGIGVEFWAGDSKIKSISRGQGDPKAISCDSPVFEEFVCMKYSDLLAIWANLNRCKQW